MFFMPTTVSGALRRLTFALLLLAVADANNILFIIDDLSAEPLGGPPGIGGMGMYHALQLGRDLASWWFVALFFGMAAVCGTAAAIVERAERQC